jgi:hypothetical protein
VAAEVNVTLQVLQIAQDDIYRDIVRVREADREANGETLPEGTLCRVTCNSGHTYAVIRGNLDRSEQAIWMDERTRKKLAVELGQCYAFELRRARVWGGLCWAWQAADYAYRMTARMAVLSLLLGFIALGLGLCTMVKP